MVAPAAGAVPQRAVGGELVRFAVVGGIGFVVDAGILTWLVSFLAWNVYAARAVSFGVAVMVTWAVNRQWTFAHRSGGRPSIAGAGAQYARYLTVQVMGALANLGVFVGVLAVWRSLIAYPVVPLGIGAVAGLLVNFVGARRWVFAPRPNSRPLVPMGASTDDTASYEGTANLEVMAEARNYNAFLVDLVLEHRQGAAQAVDFGAGIGTFAALVRDHGLDVLCVEPDPRHCAAIANRGMTAVTDLDAVPDGSVEYIYSLNVLEHVADDAAAVQLLARKLAPGGRLFVYVPAFRLLYSAMDRKIGHHRRYRRTPLVAMIEQAGLRVSYSRYADALGFLATLAYRALGSRSGDLDPRWVAAFDRFVFPASRVVDRVLDRVLGKNVYVVAVK